MVGPRYTGRPGGAVEPWTATAHLPEGEPGTAGFSLDVDLQAPADIAELASPSHRNPAPGAGRPARAGEPGPGRRRGGHRDFVLDYRLGGEGFQSGVLLSEGAEENFFLAMVAPPRRVPSEAVVPREYVFVVDISGSMHGFPLDTAKHLLRRLIGGLRPQDRFNVLLFSGSARCWRRSRSPPMPSTSSRPWGCWTPRWAVAAPSCCRPCARPWRCRRRRGVRAPSSWSPTASGRESEAYALVRGNLGKANLFAFGIGSSVNRELIEGLARAARASPSWCWTPRRPTPGRAPAADDRVAGAGAPEADLRRMDTYDVEPLELPDLFASGRWWCSASGAASAGASSAPRA